MKKLLILTTLFAACLSAQINGGAPFKPISVSPASGIGSQQTFSMVYFDTLAPSDIQAVWVVFTSTLGSANSCPIYYTAATNQLQLYSNDNQSTVSGSPGSSGTLSNSQCSINLASSSAVYGNSGYQLTLNLAMTFSGSYAGPKNIYMDTIGYAAPAAGWATMGSWTVPAGGGTLSATSASCLAVGNFANCSVTASSSGSVADIGPFLLMIGGDATHFANVCIWQYYPNGNYLYLYNDAGNAFLGYGYPGGIGNASNSTCSAPMGTATVTTTSNSVTLNLQITFATSFTGNKGVWEDVFSPTQNVATGWVNKGSITLGNSTTPKGDGIVAPTTVSGQTMIDNLTGDTITVSGSAAVPTSITLSSAVGDDPDVLNFNDAFSVTLWGAKPNTQVWAQYIVQGISNDTPPVDLLQLPVLPNNYLVGATDSAGHFVYNSTVVPTGGDHSILFFVANGSAPPFGLTDDRVFDTGLGRSAFFGAVTFFGCCDGHQAPPTLNAVHPPQTKEQTEAAVAKLRGDIKIWAADGRAFLSPLTVDGVDLKSELAKIKPANWDQKDFMDAVSMLIEMTGAYDKKEVMPKQ
jgi:hypothetical protein